MWACTEPDSNGQRYIPNERGRLDVMVSTSNNELYIYRVGDLMENCRGEVTAIEYCYQYDLINGAGEAVFNWTVLILEDAGTTSFRITNLYDIISHPDSLSGERCSTGSGNTRKCCDSEDISSFTLPMNFAFGVTGSSQGNTRGATLLAFADSLSQYQVDTILLNKDGLSLSVGSTVRRSSVDQRGLRMLGFVIGKLSMYIMCILMCNSMQLASIEPMMHQVPIVIKASIWC